MRGEAEEILTERIPSPHFVCLGDVMVLSLDMGLIEILTGVVNCQKCVIINLL
jgi:hypothetical protein